MSDSESLEEEEEDCAFFLLASSSLCLDLSSSFLWEVFHPPLELYLEEIKNVNIYNKLAHSGFLNLKFYEIMKIKGYVNTRRKKCFPVSLRNRLKSAVL